MNTPRIAASIDAAFSIGLLTAGGVLFTIRILPAGPSGWRHRPNDTDATPMQPTELLRHPPRSPLIGASILSADFAALGRECAEALDAGADLLHLDVMDGHFVPNLTMGPALCASLRAALPDAVLDAHLMVDDPAMYLGPFADAGADHLTVHIEAVPDPADLIARIHDAGMTAGLAINPPTDVAALLPHIEPADLILVMSVHPGFAGQSFIEQVLDKVRAIRSMLRPEQRLQIDGGVKPANAARCLDAGCDVLVAASAIFHADRYDRAIEHLRRPSPSDQPAKGTVL